MLTPCSSYEVKTPREYFLSGLSSKVNTHIISDNNTLYNAADQKFVTDSGTYLTAEGKIQFSIPCEQAFYVSGSYSYAQKYKTDQSQAQRFAENWFRTLDSQDFIFPVEQMTRTHQVYGHIHYTWPINFTLGTTTVLDFQRGGSKIWGFGNFSVYKEENIIPYIKYAKTSYEGYLYLPLHTYLDSRDTRENQASYVLYNYGQGKRLSWGSAHIFQNTYLIRLDIPDVQGGVLSHDYSGFKVGLKYLGNLNQKITYLAQYHYEQRKYPIGYVKTLIRDQISIPKEIPREDTEHFWGINSYYSIDNKWSVQAQYQQWWHQSNYDEYTNGRIFVSLGLNYSIKEDLDLLREDLPDSVPAATKI